MTPTGSATTPRVNAPAWVKHLRLKEWVTEMATLTQPRHVHWCDGSDAENQTLLAEMVAAGTLTKL
ncbi:MAG: phosphoenolpyruvate carboxykinase, partial [Gemmatimonadota bacterium]|nr:phosphoenolpyruvate carboxykinase [Gemmatimonadota bacterium]